MGCGESKHAVATTESVSMRKKLSLSSSKNGECFETQNDTKETDTPNVKELSVSSTPIPLPINQKPEATIEAQNVKNMEKGEEKNVVVDNNNDSNSIPNPESSSTLTLKEQEGNKENMVMEQIVVDEKGKNLEVAHERELSRDSQSDYLSVNEVKSEHQSPPRVSNEEPSLEVNDKQIDQDNESSESNMIDNEEQIENDKLDNVNEVIKEVKDEMTLAEPEATPKAEKEKDLMASTAFFGRIRQLILQRIELEAF